MRDIALTLFFSGLLMAAFRYHFIAPLMWAWIGLMSPNRLTYGFAYSLPFAQITAIVMLILLLISKERQPFPKSSTAMLLVGFYVWECITSIASFNSPDQVWEMWIKVTKIQLVLFASLMMLHGKKQVDLLVWVIVLSIGFYGFKGGLFTISRGGTAMVMGPPGSFIEVTNHLALAMLMIVPLGYYLATQCRQRWLRIGLYIVMGLTALAVLGTTSRGALLGSLVMAVMLALKSERRWTMLTIIAVLAMGMAAVMSDQWADKMGTITTHEDHSAQSRLYTWKMIWNLAMHYPVNGGGFNVTENPVTWYRFAVTDWAKAYSPHSIYFQALAEHGFVGLALYLAIGVSAWRRCTSLIRRCTTEATQWAANLARMVQVSIAGFAVGGAFVNLVNYDLPYYIVSLAILTDVAVAKLLLAERNASLLVQSSTLETRPASRAETS
ncbi:putative O-glycosylation ligase, exosortase A system-associated [Aquincola sp. S2]|uniref:O-glycosylation ligase, exosortase A system-associated n=1 Tax=Pseudaquabacterium terrae TaxID=2732868 RepID=A0ABX2EDM2_9BURK|nr:putative O-glycosylation ligase, exosortase A system-associated [Aquabacterium terrae]NRF66523.1 putative O-glycosylation ligase, exosortase A system-associated [Aquabacterium terrae]